MVGVIVVRAERVVNITDEPLVVPAVVSGTKVVNGVVGTDERSSVVARVVGTARVVWITNDPLVVSGIVSTTLVVNAVVEGADVSWVEDSDGVMVVNVDCEREMTDEPLVL